MKLKKKVKVVLYLICLTLVIGLGYNFIFKDSKSSVDNSKDNTQKPIQSKTKEALLTLVGDFLYEEPYYASLRAGDDESKYLSLVKEYFQNDDLSIGNMEVVIGNETLAVSGTGFSFCAPPSIGKQVSSIGMEVLATANNHSNDRGMEGRKSTIEYFKNNSDILTVGTYLDNPRDVSNNTLTINGIKFGFLSYTYGTNVKVPEDLRYSLGLFKNPDGGGFTPEYKQILKNEISLLREKVDALIVIMHWGVEFTYEPSKEQRNIAEFLNSLGVDIVLGSHSHSIEPIEWIHSDKRDTLVYYSMGNFVSADDDISRTGETFDNAYQFGLLSQLKVSLDDKGLYISNVTTEPIVNYYDSNMRNFLLIPFKDYNEEYEKSHYRFKYNFNRDFIKNTYEKVIDEQFR